jgi:hypothetical protein
MSDQLRQQIYNNLDLKETEELIEMWQTNDRVEWTEMAFDVLREILLTRLDDLPPQNEPVLVHPDPGCPEEFIEVEGLDKFLDPENAPLLYKPKEILRLMPWLDRAAIAAIAASVFINLYYLPNTQRVILSYLPSSLFPVGWSIFAWLTAMWITVFLVVLDCVLLYFPVKALKHVLLILMEMEFDSRRAKIKFS